MPKATTPAPVRFWAKVDKTDECWLWTAATNRGGYGVFRPGTSQHGPMMLSHRYAYELEVGPIPGQLTLDHLCKTRNCVRPDHLEPVPRGVNAMRGNGPAAQQARQTHCIRGHLLPAIEPGRRRRCKACVHMWSAHYYAKRKEATPCL